MAIDGLLAHPRNLPYGVNKLFIDLLTCVEPWVEGAHGIVNGGVHERLTVKRGVSLKYLEDYENKKT